MRCGNVHVRVVGVDEVENRVPAIRFVEQALQRAGLLRLLRDMARCAALAVLTLYLKVLVVEINRAPGAECRCLCAWIPHRMIIEDVGPDLHTCWRDSSGALIVGEPPRQSEQNNYGDCHSYPKTETPQIRFRDHNSSFS